MGANIERIRGMCYERLQGFDTFFEWLLNKMKTWKNDLFVE